MRAMTVTGAVLALVLAGCGSEDAGAGDEPKPSEAPATKDVTVTLADSIPLVLLANNDDVTCYVRPDSAEVTLRDAERSVVGTQQISGVGGESVDDGCIWSLDFPGVPRSDFYEATVKAGDWEQSATGESDASSASIEIGF